MANPGRFRGGFWDWVRNPWSVFKAEARTDALRRQLTPVGEPTPEELTRLVGLLRDHEKKYVARDILTDVGEPSVPYIVDALRGPHLWTAQPTDFSGIVDTLFAPYKIALGLLEPYSPPSLLEVVLPRIHDQDDEIRTTAVERVAQFGLDECVSATLESLRSSDKEIAKSALRGIRSCLIAGNGGTHGFRTAILDELMSLVESKRIEAEFVAESLLRLDEGKAIAILTSDEYINLENKSLHKLLRILTDSHAEFPVGKILALTETLRRDHEEYPRPHQFGACITALAEKHHATARSLVEEAMQSPNETVRRYARKALELLEGVTDASQSVFKQVQRQGLSHVEYPLRVYYCVQLLDGEVRNGGFAQYFANASGDDAGLAVRSLREIGADLTADIVERAMRVFGTDGPSPDRETRSYQLAKLRDSDFATLEGLNREFYQAADRPLELLSRFAIRHKQYFR